MAVLRAHDLSTLQKETQFFSRRLGQKARKIGARNLSELTSLRTHAEYLQNDKVNDIDVWLSISMLCQWHF
jgi:hypothetical protein